MTETTKLQLIPPDAPNGDFQVSLAQLINERAGSLVVPEHDGKPLIDPKRAALGYMVWASQTPEVRGYQPLDLMRMFMVSMKYGIDLSNPHGHGYVIPFKGKPLFIPGYKGYVHLARKLCNYQVRCGIVCRTEDGEGDVFTFDAVSQRVHHEYSQKPIDRDAFDNYAFAWAIAFDPRVGPDRPIGAIVLDKNQLRRRMQASKSGLAKTWPDRWVMKTVIRSLFNSGQVELDPDGVLGKLADHDSSVDAGLDDVQLEAAKAEKPKDTGDSVEDAVLTKMRESTSTVAVEDPVYGEKAEEPAPDPAPKPEDDSAEASKPRSGAKKGAKSRVKKTEPAPEPDVNETEKVINKFECQIEDADSVKGLVDLGAVINQQSDAVKSALRPLFRERMAQLRELEEAAPF